MISSFATVAMLLTQLSSNSLIYNAGPICTGENIMKVASNQKTVANGASLVRLLLQWTKMQLINCCTKLFIYRPEIFFKNAMCMYLYRLIQDFFNRGVNL